MILSIPSTVCDLLPLTELLIAVISFVETNVTATCDLVMLSSPTQVLYECMLAIRAHTVCHWNDLKYSTAINDEVVVPFDSMRYHFRLI